MCPGTRSPSCGLPDARRCGSGPTVVRRATPPSFPRAPGSSVYRRPCISPRTLRRCERSQCSPDYTKRNSDVAAQMRSIPGLRTTQSGPWGEQAGLDGAAFDFFGQRLHNLGDVFEVRVDGERLAIGFERVLVVADVLQNKAEAGQRPEVPRLLRQDLAQIGERVAVVLLEIIDGGAPVPGFDVIRLDRNHGVEKFYGKV